MVEIWIFPHKWLWKQRQKKQRGFPLLKHDPISVFVNNRSDEPTQKILCCLNLTNNSQICPMKDFSYWHWLLSLTQRKFLERLYFPSEPNNNIWKEQFQKCFDVVRIKQPSSCTVSTKTAFPYIVTSDSSHLLAVAIELYIVGKTEWQFVYKYSQILYKHGF